jgi:hypothetical protein
MGQPGRKGIIRARLINPTAVEKLFVLSVYPTADRKLWKGSTQKKGTIHARLINPFAVQIWGNLLPSTCPHLAANFLCLLRHLRPRPGWPISQIKMAAPSSGTGYHHSLQDLVAISGSFMMKFPLSVRLAWLGGATCASTSVPRSHLSV